MLALDTSSIQLRTANPVTPLDASFVFASQVFMVDPVIAADGHTYERTALERWLQGSCLSPVTGSKLPHTRLVPNVLVKSALAQHTKDRLL